MKTTEKRELTMHGKGVVAVVSSEILCLVAPFMGVDDVRYYLNGINVRPSPEGGTYVEATNGHMLIVARDKNGFAERPIGISVVKSDIQHARRSAALWLDDEGMAYFVNPLTFPTWASPTNRRIEGNYPDVAGAIPAVDELVEGICGSFDARYLSQILAAATERGNREKYPALRLFRKKDDKDAAGSAMVFTIADKHFGAVMPMREHVKDVLRQLIPAHRALPPPKPKEPAPTAEGAPA